MQKSIAAMPSNCETWAGANIHCAKASNTILHWSLHTSTMNIFCVMAIAGGSLVVD